MSRSESIQIEYCQVWNYEPQALRVKAQFEQAGFTNVTLVPAGGGVFEISVGGNLKYSKKANGRFPEDAEVMDIASS